jgi:hypothetical protein
MALRREVRKLLEQCSLSRLDARIAAASPTIQERVVVNPHIEPDALIGALQAGTGEHAISTLFQTHMQQASEAPQPAPQHLAESGEAQNPRQRAEHRRLGTQAIKSVAAGAESIMGLLGDRGGDHSSQLGALPICAPNYRMYALVQVVVTNFKSNLPRAGLTTLPPEDAEIFVLSDYGQNK